MTRAAAAVVEPDVYEIELPDRPMAAKDGPNARLHWRTRDRRRKYWMLMVQSHVYAGQWPRYLTENGLGWRVTFTMVARRGVEMDHDNLQGCFKAARDGLANALQINDKPGGVDWRYRWERGWPDRTVITLEKIG